MSSPVTLAWPWMLLGLFAVPVLVAAYRRLLRARAERRTRMAELGLVTGPAVGMAGDRAVGPAAGPAVGTGRRRHVAPVLFLASLVLLLIGLARPQASVAEPRREGIVVLAFDTSGSMAATDLAPSRMEAAKAAARTFVQSQPAQIRIGVVSFGDNGVITQQPTTDRAEVTAAIDQLTPGGGTAIGRGLQSALSAIVGRPVLVAQDEATGSVEAQGEDLGYTRSAAVVLLSDGENTSDPEPGPLAELASTAGVRIYPIGLGSAAGTVIDVGGFKVATALDEAALQELAEVTDGRYFAAADEQQLQQVYSSIDLRWTVVTRPLEITGLFAGAAALVLLLGAGLSWRWFGRVI